MPAETRIEKSGGGGFLRWALLTAVGAIITTAISAYFSQFRDSSRFEQERQIKQSESQAQLLLEQEKLRAEHRDFVVKRIEQHDEENQKLIDQWRGQYFSVVFENPCNQNLTVAVRAVALDGQTYVEGWYAVNPKEHSTILFTKRSWFDVYVKGADGVALAGNKQVTVDGNARFEYLDDQYFADGWFPLGHPVEVSFRRVNINQNGYGPFTYEMPCPLSFLFRKPPTQNSPFPNALHAH